VSVNSFIIVLVHHTTIWHAPCLWHCT